jgi:putative transposase
MDFTALYKRKYRVESIRLKNHDYGADGYYFITVCTRNRQFFFGDVIAGKMELSTIGEMAQKFWQEIPKHSIYAYLNEYVIMPNHVHGIICISHPPAKQDEASQPAYSNKFAPLPSNSLQAIVHSYKAAVTRWCNKNDQSHFCWQPRFYEHVIRGRDAHENIRTYIVNNPMKWEYDRNNKSNLWM